MKNTVLLGFLLALMMPPFVAWSNGIPDLTKGGKPIPIRKSKKMELLVGNLGPTGLKGWMYDERGKTDKARQIQVMEVAKGSPANGIIKVGDVILGASGDGTAPVKFQHDARKSFAYAIADAEARTPAELKMLIWRAGNDTSTMSIALETMGAYSPTAPYDCPKSMKVIKKSLDFLERRGSRLDNFGLNILPLLACNDDSLPGKAKRLETARKLILEMFPNKKNWDRMNHPTLVETGSKVAWKRTYNLIVFTEYYLATGDNPKKDNLDLLTLIDANARSVARGQSMFGTMGHQFAMQGEDGSTHGPYRVGYGPINATGLAAFLGLTLARDCNLPNPETRKKIEAGIQRAATFFASYVGRGAIPYGEHAPWTKGHSSNGKNGLAAIAFSRVKGRDSAAKYFSQLSVAAGAQRVGGHGGAFFNYMWTPLGAHAGGEASGAAYFRQVQWHLDLARTWNGDFYYNDYGSPGYNGGSFTKARLFMYSPCLLTYAMGFRQLHMTGRGWDSANRLPAEGVADAIFAGTYNPGGRSHDQLISDLASFSAVVRKRAAARFASSGEDQSLREELESIAMDEKHPSREGVIQALGAMAHPDSGPVLVKLLNDKSESVRDAAVIAFGGMPREVQLAQLDQLLKMTAALKRPPLEVHKTDPVNTGLIALTTMLFDRNGLLAESLAPVEKYSSREQLHDAIRAVATLPSGGERGKLKGVFRLLSRNDARALYNTLIDLIYIEAPADAMFADNIRFLSVELLLRLRFKEGIKTSLDLFELGGRWTQLLICREWGALGPTIETLPEADQIKERLRKFTYMSGGKKALEAIADKSKPIVTFISLK